jgi:hypothetical protein
MIALNAAYRAGDSTTPDETVRRALMQSQEAETTVA